MPLLFREYNYKGVGASLLFLCGCVLVCVHLSPQAVLFSVRAEKLLRFTSWERAPQRVLL